MMGHGVWIFREPDLAGTVLVSAAEHRELLATFDARIRAGATPRAAWRKAVSEHRLTPTWVLRAMLEIERHRLAAGLSEDLASEIAGVAERGFAKWLRPWVKGTGRIPSRTTLEALAKAVSGSTLKQLMAASRSRPMTRQQYQAKLFNLAVRYQRSKKSRTYRADLLKHMRRLAPMGGEGRKARLSADERSDIAALGGIALADKLTPEQRRLRAQAASHARWDRVRAEYARMSQNAAGHP